MESRSLQLYPVSSPKHQSLGSSNSKQTSLIPPRHSREAFQLDSNQRLPPLKARLFLLSYGKSFFTSCIIHSTFPLSSSFFFCFYFTAQLLSLQSSLLHLYYSMFCAFVSPKVQNFWIFFCFDCTTFPHALFCRLLPLVRFDNHSLILKNRVSYYYCFEI